jgi:hypothetical protein
VSLIRLYNDLRLVIPAKLVPAKAGSGNPGLEHWIPEPAPYLIRGQARNDEKNNAFPIFVSPAQAGVQFKIFKRKGPPTNDV